MPKVACIFRCLPFEATQKGTVKDCKTSSIPGTGVSLSENAAKHSLRNRSKKPDGHEPPTIAPTFSTNPAVDVPIKRSTVSS